MGIFLLIDMQFVLFIGPDSRLVMRVMFLRHNTNVPETEHQIGFPITEEQVAASQR